MAVRNPIVLKTNIPELKLLFVQMQALRSKLSELFWIAWENVGLVQPSNM